MTTPDPPPGPSWFDHYTQTLTAPPERAPPGPPSILDALHVQSDAGIEEANAQLADAERALAATGVAVDGGLGFRVDPEHAEPAIARLEKVVLELRIAKADFARRATFPPPGPDVVSHQLAVNAKAMASKAEFFLGEYARQIEETALALRAEMWGYRAADDRNAQA